MLVEGWKVSINMSLYASVPNWIQEIPDYIKEKCAGAVHIELYLLKFVPDHSRTQEMCVEVIYKESYLMEFASDYLKNQEKCNEAMRIRLASFFLVSDCFKIQEICTRAVEAESWDLTNDNFKNQEMHDDVVFEDLYALNGL